jgi:hypothetical protein
LATESPGFNAGFFTIPMTADGVDIAVDGFRHSWGDAARRVHNARLDVSMVTVTPFLLA